ncbi:Fmp42p SCDLUD_000405 [Saccharomycodes ludwigii]|uniref:Fmp42p n=1 Tax=Saccharomycodes ludwigii TaxID=36035 RepID=UPI001E852FBB|nr:hypothetical protein SCDLUD_000405 [Saccharomycodes ludwigii]KAH3902814.1 hypothetical protein SCDLUD_000405 [Saccharomycodes ludwigii]
MKKPSLPVIQIVCAVTWCLFAAGPIFGFAALKPILVSEGVYSDLCKTNSTISLNNDYAITKNMFTSGKFIPEKPCITQDLKLNMIFTIGAVVTNLCSLAVGFVLDHAGPRICGYVGVCFLTIGSFILQFSKKIQLFDPYLTGYIGLAIGGPFVFISTFQLANSIPKHSGSILALITGSFDTSSALFLFYRLYYQNVNPNCGLKTFFSWYLLVPTFILLCQLFIMPKDSYKTIGNIHKLEIEGLNESGFIPQEVIDTTQDGDERASLIRANSQGLDPVKSTHSGRRKSVVELAVENKLKSKTNGIFGVLHNYTAMQQLKTPWYFLMQGFTIICMLRINYFVATIRSQEEFLLGSYEEALRLNGIFDVALPLGGVIAIPFIGIILDHMATLSVLVLVTCISVIIGILGLIPHSFTANLIGILILVAYRPFYYTVVSDYCAKVFGFETFGTVYGLLMTIAGLLNLLQSVFDRWTHSVFKMNPTPINSILVLITILFGGSLFFYIKLQLKKISQDNEASPSSSTHGLSETTYGSV